MRTFFLAIALMMSITSFSQEKYTVQKDDKSSDLIFNGVLNFRDLEFEDNFNYWMKGSKTYKADTTAIKYLKQHLGDYKMTVFLGTWCDDSHNIIPKLYKVLQLTGYNMGNLMMYGVDREKKTTDGQQLLYGIKNVPTIILYKNNKEAGRIVESVQKSVEDDLVVLIANDRHK